MEKYKIGIVDGKYWIMRRKCVFWWRKLMGFNLDYRRALEMIAYFREQK